jgi:hypothetical protein
VPTDYSIRQEESGLFVAEPFVGFRAGDHFELADPEPEETKPAEGTPVPAVSSRYMQRRKPSGRWIEPT